MLRVLSQSLPAPIPVRKLTTESQTISYFSYFGFLISCLLFKAGLGFLFSAYTTFQTCPTYRSDGRYHHIPFYIKCNTNLHDFAGTKLGIGMSLTISLIFVVQASSLREMTPIIPRMPARVDDAGPCGYVTRKPQRKRETKNNL